MRILWMTNNPLPEANLRMGDKPLPSGGWIINMSKQISDNPNISLSIAFPKKGIKEIKRIQGENITYFAFKPIEDNERELIKNNLTLKKIIDKVKPTIVHIYGTEFPHTLSMVNICSKEKIKTVISIQGLVSIICKHIYSNLPLRVIYGSTVRNLLFKDSIQELKKKYFKRGKDEIEALQKANHVIGRTTWDKACTYNINKKIKYHYCNETLRDEFYKNKWEINQVEKHSIFLSQTNFPIKGLHYIIEAMPLILKNYPNAKVYISGKNIIKSDTLKDKLLMTCYGKYIKKMIKKYELGKHMVFTGILNEHQMCQRYLKSNVFVCPSSIENSPNSLGEAMILGVPCVASNVGGIPDMLKHKVEGYLYPADAPYMLAYYVCKIFRDKNIAKTFSKKAREHALITHSREKNYKTLIDIYSKISKD